MDIETIKHMHIMRNHINEYEYGFASSFFCQLQNDIGNKNKYSILWNRTKQFDGVLILYDTVDLEQGWCVRSNDMGDLYSLWCEMMEVEKRI